MDTIRIRRFAEADSAGVIALILPIQREEFGIAITAADQPDLAMIPSFYQTGRGDFLVAESQGRIVGTIAMKDFGDGRVALRKMFVAAERRGRVGGIAQTLLDTLLALASDRKVTEVWLGTNAALLASHRFYERNRFDRVDATILPGKFPRMAVDTIFYRRLLHP